MVREVRACLGHRRWSRRNGIGLLPDRVRDRHTAHEPCEPRLHGAGLVSGTQSALPDRHDSEDEPSHRQEADEGKYPGSSTHHFGDARARSWLQRGPARDRLESSSPGGSLDLLGPAENLSCCSIIGRSDHDDEPTVLVADTGRGACYEGRAGVHPGLLPRRRLGQVAVGDALKSRDREARGLSHGDDGASYDRKGAASRDPVTLLAERLHRLDVLRPNEQAHVAFGGAEAVARLGDGVGSGWGARGSAGRREDGGTKDCNELHRIPPEGVDHPRFSKVRAVGPGELAERKTLESRQSGALPSRGAPSVRYRV